MKSKKNNTVSVLLIRGADNSNLSFNINLHVLRLLGVLLVLFLTALLLFVLFYGRMSYRFLMISNLLRENEDLRMKVQKIELLTGEIEKIRHYEKKIKLLTMNASETTVQAKGKTEMESVVLPSRALDAYEKEIDDFVQNIKLYRNMEFLRTKDLVKQKQKILEAVPNILPWTAGFRADSKTSWMTSARIISASTSPAPMTLPFMPRERGSSFSRTGKKISDIWPRLIMALASFRAMAIAPSLWLRKAIWSNADRRSPLSAAPDALPRRICISKFLKMAKVKTR
jgi:hypothetical protein